MPPPVTAMNNHNSSSRNNESSVSFFDESFQVVSGDSPAAPSPKAAVSSPRQQPQQERAPIPTLSPLTPHGGRRRPGVALPKIPRSSLRGKTPPRVMNVKPQQSPRDRSNSNSPVRGVGNNVKIPSLSGNLDSSESSRQGISPQHVQSARRRNNNGNNNSRSASVSFSPNNNGSSSSSGFVPPPALLPSISASTIATADVFMDEHDDDSNDVESNNRRRRSNASLGSGVNKVKIQQLLHASDNDQSMGVGVSSPSPPTSDNPDDDQFLDEGHNSLTISKGSNDAPPRQPQRRAPSSRTIGSVSGLSGLTDLEKNAVNDKGDDPVAQEQAVAIAADIFHRRNNAYASDDGSVATMRSAHRCRDQYDPDLDFLHSSIHTAAFMEKEGLSYIGEEEGEENPLYDEHLLTEALGETKTRWEACWSRVGAWLLCALVLAFWGGVIPYCIVRYNNQDRTDDMPDVNMTAPPTDNNMIPWTPTPTVSPGTRKPTSAPTPLNANQELLDLLGATPAPAPTVAPENTATSNVTNDIVNLTLSPMISQANGTETMMPSVSDLTSNTTNAPTAPVNTTTIAPTSLFVAATSAPSNSPTTLPPNTTTSSPTVAPTTTEPTQPQEPTTSPAPTSSPSMQPSGQPEVVFPDYTLRAFNNPASPQSKAFSWMLRDPNFGAYSPNRMRQRFALATLYYATNGDDWVIQQQNSLARTENNASTTYIANDDRGGIMPWLSYPGHECDWYYQRTTPYNQAEEEGSTSRATAALLEQYSSNRMGVAVCENEIHSDGIFRAYRALWLENSGLQGALPAELAMLTGLEQVQFANNGLFGSLPKQWFWDDKETPVTWQTSLEDFSLKNNSIAGRIPSEIGLASNLKKMDIQQNQIQRRIPTEIGLLVRLKHLLWNDNQLSGPIPTEIGSMSSLTACSWNNNSLTGEIPSEVGRAMALQELYLGSNQLTGSIPWHLCFLRGSLVDLHLYSNQLTQDIPTRLGLLTKLRWFDGANNQLKGRIPSELGQMTMLQLFQVENNELEGRLPSEHLAAWDIASRVWIHGNPELYGTIPYAWCPGGELTNGTTLSVTSDRSVDIRVDCNNEVTCPCADGCSCE